MIDYIIRSENNQDFAEINKWYKSEHLEYYVTDDEDRCQSADQTGLEAGIYLQEDITYVKPIKGLCDQFTFISHLCEHSTSHIIFDLCKVI